MTQKVIFIALILTVALFGCKKNDDVPEKKASKDAFTEHKPLDMSPKGQGLVKFSE